MIHPWRMHCTSQAEAMLNSENIKPVALAVIKLRLPEGVEKCRIIIVII